MEGAKKKRERDEEGEEGVDAVSMTKYARGVVEGGGGGKWCNVKRRGMLSENKHVFLSDTVTNQ